MAKKLISYDDEAEGTGLPEVVENRLTSTFPPMGGMSQRLDWQGITLPNTVAETIPMFTSTLGDAAERKEIGTASNDFPIYAFTAGNPTAPHALLVSGIHGHELQPVGAAWRWFEAFALKTSPAMAELHSRLRVTWVPHLNPSGYDAYTRENSGGVDLNRNFPYNWELETTADKGEAFLSEPESQAIKSFIDTEDIACVLDCHNAGFEPDFGSTVTIVGPPQHTSGDRGVAEAALTDMRDWLGGDDPTYKFATFPTSTSPTLKNWASQYLRWERKKTNANAAIIEAAANLRGSLTHTISDEGARLYCSMIHAYLTRWLTEGQKPRKSGPYTIYGRSWGAIEALPVSDPSGNGRVVNTTQTPIRFSVSGGPTGDYVGFPIHGPGTYIISYDVSVLGSEDTTFRTLLRFGPAQTSGDAPLSPLGRGVIPLREGEHATFARTAHITITEAQMPEDVQFYMVQLMVAVDAGTALMAVNNGANLSVQYSPDTTQEPVPAVRINRS